MVKGIRVNQLAKELGVESKAILTKLRDEGVPNVPTNHQGTIALGLAASVREWFSSAESANSGGTAVETAAPVETALKKAASRSRKKNAAETSEHDTSDNNGSSTAVAEPPAIEAPAPAPAPIAEPVVKAPHPVIAPIVKEIAPPPEVEVAPAPAAIAPPPVAPPQPAAPLAPAATAAPATPAPAHPKGRPTQQSAPISRPTITLASRNQPPVERKAVTPAPQMVAPTPAVMKGPNVIREEKPDHVPAPRRRPVGPNAEPASGITQARALGGRGVKVTEEDETEEGKKKAAGKTKSLSSRRRSLDGRRGEADEKLREFTDADLRGLEERLAAASQSRAAFDSHLKKSEARGTHEQARTAAERGGAMDIEEPITVRTLSSALGVKTNDIIGKLMKQGVFATINQALENDLAETLALEFGVELHIRQQKTQEEILASEFDTRQAAAVNLVPRPAVVTILGHVDHGKTSLLDKIRNANVAAGEAGGITQHTAAWQVEVGEGKDKKRVTFIDTPGHQAFTSMRARGANMTDVVVLVVSAAEGVQPQTIESINHAKAAGVPLIVALNKIDRPDANPDMVLGQLAKEELNPVEWGGTTEVIRTSAVTGQGIPELIEILDYQSQLLELKSDPSAPARGTVIESRMNEGLGPIATVLVQNGTLRVGDVILSGNGYGRIRMIQNDRGQSIQEATASTPVIISGLNALPNAGDKFYAVEDVDRAKTIAEDRQMASRQHSLSQQGKVSLDNLFETMKAADTKTINLIIKGDVQGSVETLAKTVNDQNTSEVRVRVIHSAVGPISESDVELADASKAVIIGFHVVPDDAARAMAEQRRVEIRTYRVIYEIFDDMKKALSGLLEPEVREKYHGRVEVRRVFKISKLGTIAGCMVTDGHIQRGSKIRLIRDGRVITEDLTIDTLRRVKEDVKEVKQGFECGIKLAGYDDVKEGDTLEGYIRETIAPNFIKVFAG